MAFKPLNAAMIGGVTGLVLFGIVATLEGNGISNRAVTFVVLGAISSLFGSFLRGKVC